MVTDIIKGQHYKAKIVGFNDDNSLFVEINNKFTAYLDVSMYNYTTEEIQEKFKIMSDVEVFVMNIDESGKILCTIDNSSDYNNEKITSKSQKQNKSKSSEPLTYNLGSMLSGIKLNNK